MITGKELPIDTSATAQDMADAMFGEGIKITSASYTGADSASGIYSNADEVVPGVAPSDSGVILSTGSAQDFTQSEGDANTASGTTTNHQLAGDAQLTAMSGQQTYDAAVFEAEFEPAGSTLTMQVVFSSEE
ncbi:MAG: choice-of-anchor L domain-containing protein, partial [Pseudomonadota bacterium]